MLTLASLVSSQVCASAWTVTCGLVSAVCVCGVGLEDNVLCSVFKLSAVNPSSARSLPRQWSPLASV